MSITDLLGAGGGRRQEYEDFVNRYEQGEPWDGVSDNEAMSRYDEVSSRLSDDDYELSAQEAFQRLSPDQRRELARMLRQQGRERGVQLAEFDDDDDERYARDPRELARMTRQVRKEQPGGLGALLGGGEGGGVGAMLGNPLAKAALAGVAAKAAKRMLS
jgi:hypothetical protein